MRNWIRAFAVLFCSGLVASSCGSDKERPKDPNNPCGLTPSGTLTDGTLSGTMDFAGGQQKFPLSVLLQAASHSFTGTLSFHDSYQSFSGSIQGSIDSGGAMSGAWTATGASDGGKVTGGVLGFTDNQRACGTWQNNFNQSGTWLVARQ
jgi:hypothetical protein